MANPNKRKGGQERPVRLKWFGIPAMLPLSSPTGGCSSLSW